MNRVATEMTPRRWAQLIRRLERASDDPRLSHEIRIRIDRNLHNMKTILRRQRGEAPAAKWICLSASG